MNRPEGNTCCYILKICIEWFKANLDRGLDDAMVLALKSYKYTGRTQLLIHYFCRKAIFYRTIAGDTDKSLIYSRAGRYLVC